MRRSRRPRLAAARCSRPSPRAAAARYDRATGRVVVDLVNGGYAFPARLVQEPQGARHDDLAGVEVDGHGFDLHGPALDVDLYVPALVAGIFGTRAWMAREFRPYRWAGEIAGQGGGGPLERCERRPPSQGGKRLVEAFKSVAEPCAAPETIDTKAAFA